MLCTFPVLACYRAFTFSKNLNKETKMLLLLSSLSSSLKGYKLPWFCILFVGVLFFLVLNLNFFGMLAHKQVKKNLNK
jgi:hypothetical protein